MIIHKWKLPASCIVSCYACVLTCHDVHELVGDGRFPLFPLQHRVFVVVGHALEFIPAQVDVSSDGPAKELRYVDKYIEPALGGVCGTHTA